ncbi:Dimethylaniline monooxygenase [N-oxide-forming] 1 [Exaiptasia diaphana]|nr:Dimethylaniline monooxygenase [N-oxide-forming] 1 [Exaiptasia diaphana]
MSKQKRICVIGSGPSGMAVLHQYNKLKQHGKDVPQIVCYEKQSDWGGLWVYNWETGIDQYGEPVHGSMYRGMWSNNPKEVIELPDYTFQDHFKKPIPSFLPREAMLDYLKAKVYDATLKLRPLLVLGTGFRRLLVLSREKFLFMDKITR